MKTQHLDYTRLVGIGRLLPSQMAAMPSTPERALLVAVMARALMDWERERWLENGVGEATRWFESSRMDRLYSFLYVCHHLGLDPRAIRDALKKRRTAWRAGTQGSASGGYSGEGNECSRWKNLLRTG